MKYFETYKANFIKFNLTHVAQKKSGNDYDYWQNPIEWPNHMSKSAINENSEICSVHAYKTKSLPNVIKALKNLYLCYYGFVSNDLTGCGSYILTFPFRNY